MSVLQTDALPLRHLVEFVLLDSTRNLVYIQRIKTAGALRRLFCDSILVNLSLYPERVHLCVVGGAHHNQWQNQYEGCI